DRTLGRDRLEAPAVAAAAHGAVRAHLAVAVLTREAGGSVVEPTADDEAGTDAGAESHVDHVGQAAAGAERDLGEGAEVGIVVNRHPQAESARERLPRRQACRAG